MAQQGTPQAVGNSSSPASVSGGFVNAPIIFESVPAISKAPEIWIGVSGSDPHYGGCQINLSTDAGNSYDPVGLISGSQMTGSVYSSNYPSHADPDSSDTLHVDLTESNGVLPSWLTADQNNFISLCYLAGGGSIVINGQTLTIPYELVALGATTLAATSKYSCAPPIRRTVKGTPQAAHNIGSKFSFLRDGHIFRMALPPSLIGVTLNFKFLSFNVWRQAPQGLGDVSPYTFTPSGLVGWSNGTGPTGIPFPTGGPDPSISAVYDIAVYYPTLQTSATQEFFRNKIEHALSFAANFAGSGGSVDSSKAATGSTVLNVNKNGSSVGTITWGAAGTSPTFATSGGAVQTFSAGDILTITGPGTPDATLSNWGLTLVATRS